MAGPGTSVGSMSTSNGAANRLRPKPTDPWMALPTKSTANARISWVALIVRGASHNGAGPGRVPACPDVERSARRCRWTSGIGPGTHDR